MPNANNVIKQYDPNNLHKEAYRFIDCCCNDGNKRSLVGMSIHEWLYLTLRLVILFCHRIMGILQIGLKCLSILEKAELRNQSHNHLFYSFLLRLLLILIRNHDCRMLR